MGVHPRASRWSALAIEVSEREGTCACPAVNGEPPKAERTMRGGISRNLCSRCGKHRVVRER